MAQDEGLDRQLQAIEAGLRRDDPRLHAKLAESGALFAGVRLVIAVGVLVLAFAVLTQMSSLGIGAAYFAVVLLIIGVTETVRRALQLRGLVMGRRGQRR
ncbi:hypothetical protein ACFYZE_35320 [Streptomyces sp. NPDC001796]|uniref:hypothetical protein n=1 Tax=Streptomyces sp. NPDC001796 TaxID=3364609 RepID=UPI0036BCE12E